MNILRNQSSPFALLLCLSFMFVFGRSVQTYGFSYNTTYNFTHRANISISIDGQHRGVLPIGLYGNESPKAVLNFLSQCETEVEQKNLDNIRKMNVTKASKKFSFENKPIYRIFDDSHMQFGDYFYHPKHRSRGNITVFGSSYYSEINEIETGLGALAQERNEESGHVGSEYSIFKTRASYDGSQSLWHVFGQVYSNPELLKYIFYTAAENDGIPIRNVTISHCVITQYS